VGTGFPEGEKIEDGEKERKPRRESRKRMEEERTSGNLENYPNEVE
jgi:hypothetical protein